MEASAVVGGGDQVSAGTERRMEMKVVVAMDDSDDSFHGLKWALDHLFIPTATPENGGMVFLVHVQPKVFEYGYPLEAGGTGSYTLTLPSFHCSLLEIGKQDDFC